MAVSPMVILQVADLITNSSDLKWGFTLRFHALKAFVATAFPITSYSKSTARELGKTTNLIIKHGKIKKLIQKLLKDKSNHPLEYEVWNVKSCESLVF